MAAYIPINKCTEGEQYISSSFRHWNIYEDIKQARSVNFNCRITKSEERSITQLTDLLRKRREKLEHRGYGREAGRCCHAGVAARRERVKMEG
jgi:hypothetical protein